MPLKMKERKTFLLCGGKLRGRYLEGTKNFFLLFKTF